MLVPHSSASAPTRIRCHGYGANGTDVTLPGTRGGIDDPLRFPGFVPRLGKRGDLESQTEPSRSEIRPEKRMTVELIAKPPRKSAFPSWVRRGQWWPNGACSINPPPPTPPNPGGEFSKEWLDRAFKLLKRRRTLPAFNQPSLPAVRMAAGMPLPQGAALRSNWGASLFDRPHDG